MTKKALDLDVVSTNVRAQIVLARSATLREAVRRAEAVASAARELALDATLEHDPDKIDAPTLVPIFGALEVVSNALNAWTWRDDTSRRAILGAFECAVETAARLPIDHPARVALENAN